MTGANQGLRARKRAATERAIEKAALELAIKHGYDRVTVDMICEASMVSQRTFFNYFGSKEGVILGKTPASPTPEIVEEFVQGRKGNAIGDLVLMIASTMASHEPDLGLFQARRRLILQTPDLMTKEKARMGEAEGRLRQLVLSRFEAQGRIAATDGDLEDEARMVVMLSLGAMHWMIQTWVASNFELDRTALLAKTSELVRRATSGMTEE